MYIYIYILIHTHTLTGQEYTHCAFNLSLAMFRAFFFGRCSGIFRPCLITGSRVEQWLHKKALLKDDQHFMTHDFRVGCCVFSGRKALVAEATHGTSACGC